MKSPRPLFVSLLIAAVLFTSQPTFACGPYSLEAVFTFSSHPEFPLEKFAGGEVGVLQPTLARSYLVATYRNFAGPAFSPKEQKDLEAMWAGRMHYGDPDLEEWTQPWFAARKAITGVGETSGISIYRHRVEPNQYETYVNCQKDAFETAANTLTERAKKFGADSAAVKEWIAAQDMVFANCSEGQHVPADAPANADPLIRADRSYQIAAANFYAGSFDESQKLFETIARDTNSPWRQIAAYLSGRVLLRKASLGAAEKKAEALTEAEGVFKKVLSDGSLTKIHPASKKLLGLVRLRLHPDLRLRELAQALTKKGDETLKQDVLDYTILLDDFTGDEDSDPKKEFPEELRKDDLTDWILTVEAGGDAATTHAVERWQATSSTPWLIAALAKVPTNHPQAGALLSIAEKIRPESPAFASSVFHQIRLAIEGGRVNQAREKLDELLAKHKARLPVTSLNLFLGQRMRLARSLEEVLTFAQRQPAGFSWGEDDQETIAEISEDSELDKSMIGKTLFDTDGGQILNDKLPLTVLQRAAVAKELPDHLRRDVAQATWLRAVMLDNPKVARELTPTLKGLLPAAGSLLDDYLAAQPGEVQKFSAIYAWLKLPGLQPMAHAGIGRRTAPDKQDEYRDNWWCTAAFPAAPASEETAEETAKKAETAKSVAVKAEADFPAFLSQAEKTAAQAERTRLASFGAAPNYLCQQVIAFVEKHPTDPRAPEALHLAVKTTRYGCTDKQTGKWSKAAYDLLRKRFPNNPWTKKTPYWFKD